MNIPFMFEETTRDYQWVTLQGMLTVRATDPETLAKVLNFTIKDGSGAYESKDPERLPDQMVRRLQVAFRSQLQALDLTEALAFTTDQVATVKQALAESDYLKELGLACIDLSLMVVKPKPETAKALEAHKREALLKEADSAIYERRNAAIAQERAIRENELETEQAVVEKERAIEEAKLERALSLQQKRQGMARERMASDTFLEKEREHLVQLATKNANLEADSKAYSLAASLKPFLAMPETTLEALSRMQMDPGQLIADAFQGLAKNTHKIGELNISPDLLSKLIENKRG